MRERMFENRTPRERSEILSANAQKREEFSYFKTLTEDELNEVREAYFKSRAEIDAAQADLDRAKAEFKEATAIPKADAKESYETIKMKGVQVTEEVYLVPNHDSSTMDYVTEDGVVVYSRKLQASEKQYMLKVSNE